MNNSKKGQVMDKKEFLKNGLYAKEQYEGLLVSADTNANLYNFGVQLTDDKVLFVDQVDESRVRERIQNWAPQINRIQREYRI